MRLFNAHRKVSLRLNTPKKILDLVPENQQWRYKVTPDVVNFIEKQRLQRSKQLGSIVRSPERYFSDPSNVPLERRQEIYLPEFVITMIRRRMPPRYATFEVPLWFNKLDMKDYLLRAYGVNTIHIRSTVKLQKVYREQKPSRGKTGKKPGSRMRPMSKKRMVVHLEKPFAWPARIKDLSAFEKDTFQAAMKERQKSAEAQQAKLKGMPLEDEDSRDSIAVQAKAILQGKTPWKPTWQTLAANTRIATNRPPLPPPPSS